MNIKKLSAKYDRLYEEADKLFKRHNPCQFEEGRCASNRIYAGWERGKGGCCGRCRHVGPKGCRVKALGCKVFICSWIKEKGPTEFNAKISKLREETFRIMGTRTCYLGKGKFLSFSRRIPVIYKWVKEQKVQGKSRSSRRKEGIKC